MAKRESWYKEPLLKFNVAFLLLLIVLTNVVPTSKLPLLDFHTRMLFPDTTKTFTSQEVAIHNSNLLTLLQGDLARQSNEVGTRENTRTQNRLFYVTILAALVVVIAGAGRSIAIIAVPMVLTICMYGLEINQDDLNRRGIDFYNIGITASEDLVHFSANDTTWYAKDGRLVQAKEDSVHKTSLTRKLKKAFHPAADQWILYVFPFWLMWQSILWRYSPLTRDKVMTLLM